MAATPPSPLPSLQRQRLLLPLLLTFVCASPCDAVVVAPSRAGGAEVFMEQGQNPQGNLTGLDVEISHPRVAGAEVFTERGQSPLGNLTGAELLRFVTAYRTGLEALVDITPYAPLLNAAADTDGNIHFYAFIDTWVNNGNGTDVLFMDNVTGQCIVKQHTDGNGWALTLDLVLWPRKQAADTRPYRSIALASGYFGARYPFGFVDVHEGNTSESRPTIHLDKPADFSGAAVAPPVYMCPNGKKDAMRAALLGYAAQESERLEWQQGTLEEKRTARKEVALKLVEMLVWPHLKEINIIDTFDKDRAVFATYDPSTVAAVPGMLIFYASTDVYTQQRLYQDLWLNMTFPFKAVGHVVHAVNGSMLLQMKYPCLPSSATNNLPKLLVPSGPSVISEAEALIGSAMRTGRITAFTSAANSDEADVDNPNPGGAAAAAADTSEDQLDDGAAAAEISGNEPDGDSGDNGAAETNEDVSDVGNEAGSVTEPLLLEPKDGGWWRWQSATELKAMTEAGMEAPTMAQEQFLTPTVLLGRVDIPQDDDAPETEIVNASGKVHLAAKGKNSSAASADASTADLAQKGTRGDGNNMRACVVVQHRPGRIFTRTFKLPRVPWGDRVVLQLSVTGHGWAETTEQCGEYCHAVYHLNLNGVIVANVTQFRNDCKINPIDGSQQHGTWWESRNGWCPGTVEPGLFMDVTPWAKQGENNFEFGVTVWNNITGIYEPYTDFAGFALGDQASLTVGLSAFIYAVDAVTAIRKQGRAYTAAEAALRDGSSNFVALNPPASVQWSSEARPVLMQLPGRSSRRGGPAAGLTEVEVEVEQEEALERRHSGGGGGGGGLLSGGAAPTHSAASATRSFLQEGSARAGLMRRSRNQPASAPASAAGTGGRFDFEGRAPWYLYNESVEGVVGADAGASRVRIFQGALLQGSSRVVTAKIPLLNQWGQAALQLRLHRPPGMEYDHWDRQASVGILLGDDMQDAVIHLPPQPKLHGHLSYSAASGGNSLAARAAGSGGGGRRGQPPPRPSPPAGAAASLSSLSSASI